LAIAIVATLASSVSGVREAFSSEFVVANDARLNVFWMQQFDDPQLFENDLIADYYKFLAPAGYVALYRGAAAIGVPPLEFNKLLPVGLIVISAVLCFLVVESMVPLSAAACAASILLAQCLWMDNDVSSGTARAFGYPLLFAVLLCLIRRGDASRTPRARALYSASLIVLGAVHASLDPPSALLSVGLIALDAVARVWRGRGGLADVRASMGVAALAALAALAVALPYARRDDFGDLTSGSAARDLPAFRENGRIPFFTGELWEFWLLNDYSAFAPQRLQPPTLLVGLLLPVVLGAPRRFPLARQVRDHVKLLLYLVVAATVLYLLAHALLFRLYFPSRYTHTALRIAMPPAAAIALAVLLDGARSGLRNHLRRGSQVIAGALLVTVSGVLLLYPLWAESYPSSSYHHGAAPPLYRFLRKQPRDIQVASLSALADDVPVFAGRTVLVSPHYEMPWHREYRERFHERALAILTAQYTSDPAELAAVIERWGIDYWLVDADSFSPDYLRSPWLTRLQPACERARALLERGGTPAIATAADRCVALGADGYLLLDAGCLAGAGAELVPPSVPLARS
jgi:hypothetical protein